jgi:hypothetical protein
MVSLPRFADCMVPDGHAEGGTGRLDDLAFGGEALARALHPAYEAPRS